MVSVTIFIVVMTIALGSLLSISAAERKAEALKTVMNNLNFGLESMSRAIRTGITYHCGETGTIDVPLNCPDQVNGDDYFAFEAIGGDINNSGDQVVYYFEPTAGNCGSSHIGGCIMRSVTSGGNPVPITAPEVNITSLTFFVVGAVASFDGEDPPVQPKVVITLTGQIAAGASQPTRFNLQTAVTQRLYDQ